MHYLLRQRTISSVQQSRSQCRRLTTAYTVLLQPQNAGRQDRVLLLLRLPLRLDAHRLSPLQRLLHVLRHLCAAGESILPHTISSSHGNMSTIVSGGG